MSNIWVGETDFSEFEAQFSRPTRVEPTDGQRRVRGWAIVLLASAVLWCGIGYAIAAAVHALS